ncbi:MAG: NAD-dependent epimerase/dehydratase family protein [Rhizobiaceae bacterium]|jgi:dihydroflavonol-4-reductase|nr:NAD-dependent epimerase/dehydratase family protein [Rhizobiaceae bacterium]
MPKSHRDPVLASVLVTGANGFIASHVVELLLQRGHRVTGTVRDPGNRDKTAHLAAMPGAGERLSLVAADLTDPDPFTAHADVDAIIHCASPYIIDVEDAERDLVRPAVQGTLAAMTAALAQPRVKRVVLTSSMAAITDEPDGRMLTESDWNNRSSLTRNPYYFSKTQAEHAAWDFMDAKDPHFELAVINPFLVVGPAHTRAINESNRVLADLVNGKYPALMALEWGFVDVRDVAVAHVAAMESQTARGRYILASGTMTMASVVETARTLGWGKTKASGKLPALDLSGPVGTALMMFAARFQPAGVRSYLQTHLGRSPRFSNAKSIRELGLAYRSPEAAVRDALLDLERWGHIPSRG